MKNPYQPKWVLLSASGDHQSCSLEESLDDPELLAARELNTRCPSRLEQPPSRKSFGNFRRKIALVIAGELRCYERNKEFLTGLGEQIDIFTVTTSRFGEAAQKISKKERCFIIDDHIKEFNEDLGLPVSSMKQWHKLSIGLEMIKNSEKFQGWQYKYVIKLRTDYHFVHPQRFIKNVVEACQGNDFGLIGASDKVFAGSRDLMMLLQAFYANLNGWFDQKEGGYWPINARQVLLSDDSIKWYGLNWPIDLVGTPSNTEIWRQQLHKGGRSLADSLAKFKPNHDTKYHRLFKGHPRFASEVSFARFLNFNGIPFRDCRSLRGFLYSDRNTCP
ncbi:hypothetical protein [Synechococcus sp. A18-25c]|uniref:hypothetical protein n=1 Tax=Synechococcus sp. A18-25c TaxID=1866938 RepID=UPI00164592F6|nr:hypothetical protein [Synechococcus sp. A18-25c]